jgi:hypothetical protein
MCLVALSGTRFCTCVGSVFYPLLEGLGIATGLEGLLGHGVSCLALLRAVEVESVDRSPPFRAYRTW